MLELSSVNFAEKVSNRAELYLNTERFILEHSQHTARFAIKALFKNIT